MIQFCVRLSSVADVVCNVTSVTSVTLWLNGVLCILEQKLLLTAMEIRIYGIDWYPK